MKDEMEAWALVRPKSTQGIEALNPELALNQHNDEELWVSKLWAPHGYYVISSA